MTDTARDIQLRLPLSPDFTRLAASSAEQAAEAFGLGRGEALKLCLATEEVFEYLCHSLGPGARVELDLSGHAYYVRLRLRFGRSEVDFRLLNLAAGFSPDRPEDLERLGLLLASRTVARFSLQALGTDQMELVLDMHKAYPAPAPRPAQPVPPLHGPRLAEPGPAEIKELSLLLTAHYPPTAYPGGFARPGKLADMALSGEYRLLAAGDSRGGLGGLAVWRHDGKSVMLYGPYVFGQPDSQVLGRMLVDECLARVAKSGALGVICRYPSADLPREDFELLGQLSLRRSDGSDLPWPHYYRQLGEDAGAWVWCHPDLRDYLEGEYRRLFLPRGIRELSSAGESRPEHSVLSAHLDRDQGRATLALVWDGRDMAANIQSHVAALNGDGIANLFLSLDLGSQWQAGLLPEIRAAGFAPRLVLPSLGQGDLVIFQKGLD